jgi:hypothetical protein
MKTNRASRIEFGGAPARSATPLFLQTGTEANEGNEGWSLRFLCSLLLRAPVQKRRRLPAWRVLPAQFKTWRLFGTVLFLFTAHVFVRAQNFSIDWFTIDGGGGTSTGGVYSVSGTIGQPDAGTMSGGSYSLAGGFWGIVSAVQTPGAPLLTICLTQTNTVLVSWPSPSSGFSLQQNSNLNTSVWNAPAENITDNGTNKFIIVNPPTGHRFYRLFKP